MESPKYSKWLVLCLGNRTLCGCLTLSIQYVYELLSSIPKQPFGVLAGANIKPFFYSHNKKSIIFFKYFLTPLMAPISIIFD
jgi:hypothetical protein